MKVEGVYFRGEINWSNKTNLTAPLFIEVLVPSQESSVCYGINLNLSTIFQLGFGIVLTV